MKIIKALNIICTGCEMCLLNCSQEKEGIMNPRLARLRLGHNKKGELTPLFCRHCKKPHCLAACPIEGAMTKDPETGITTINPQLCDGCLDCVEACPFDALQVGPDKEPLKCDLCGGDPTCVKYCPSRPENSLPHLNFPEQSCLQFVERKQSIKPSATQGGDNG